MDHTAFIFFWATVFRVRAEIGNVFPVPDGLDPAGCLGLRNSSPLCWAEPFFSLCGGGWVHPSPGGHSVLGVMLPHLHLVTLSLLTLIFCFRETWAQLCRPSAAGLIVSISGFRLREISLL